MLLPSVVDNCVQEVVSNPLLSTLYNHTSVLLIFDASIDTTWLGTGFVTLKLPVCNAPCLTCIKNPELELPAPWPSSLNKNAGDVPGNGASSFIVVFEMSALTISNLTLLPSMFFVNGKIAVSVFVALNLYFCVCIPSILAFFKGLPIELFTGNAAFKIFVNCSK